MVTKAGYQGWWLWLANSVTKELTMVTDLGYQRQKPSLFFIFYENFAISDNFWMWNASNFGKFKESFKECVENEENGGYWRW